MKLFGNKHGGSFWKKPSVSGDRPAAKPQQKKPRLTGVQRGALLLAGSVVVLGVTVAAVYKAVVRPVDINQPSQTAPSDQETEETFQPPTVTEIQVSVNEETGEELELEVEIPASHKEGVYNILIAGTDDDGTRTDTIMVGHLDTNDHTAALLSIPRDTLIDGDYTVPKINSVYGAAGKGEKGMGALVKRVASLLGFEVDGYALVDLDAFIELVDLVGGVDFDVPQDMDYDDPAQDLHIHFKAGMQHLDGQAAMEMVRFRKGYATQDIRRTEVQQEFLQVLAQKCLKEIKLSDIGKLANIFFENVLTDLSLGNIAYFGQELLKCDFDEMFSYTLEGEAVMRKGLSYYAVYLNKTLKVVNEHFNPYEADITEANVSIITPEAVKAENAAAAQPEPEEEVPEEPTEPEETPSDLPEEPENQEEPVDPLDPNGLWQDPWDDSELWGEDEYWP